MKRRHFLALAGGGLFSFTLFSDRPTHNDSEKALTDIRTEINQRDLANPHESPTLVKKLETALRQSQKGLNSNATKRRRQIARLTHSLNQLAGGLPGIQSPPKTPPLEVELAAITAANSYYTALLEYLHASESLRAKLLTVDYAILAEEQEKSRLLVTEDTDRAVAKTLSNIERVERKITANPNENLSSLLPNREQVRQELNQLQAIYSLYSEVQHDYVLTSELVSEGILYREKQAFDSAVASLSEAEMDINTEIPDQYRSYSLDLNSIPLKSYQRMLNAYIGGIPLLRASCSGTAETKKTLNQFFTDGLDWLLDARAELEAVKMS